MAQIPAMAQLRKLQVVIARATMINRSAKKEPGRYAPIIVGAFIGLIPSMILLGSQAVFQQQQALFSHRLTLLTELSTTVHVDGSAILSTISDIELEIYQLPETLTAEQDAGLSKKLLDLNRSELTWIGKMSVQMNIMNALFTLEKTLPTFLPKLEDVSILGATRRQLSGSNWKSPLLNAMMESRKNILSSMNHMQSALTKINGALNYY